MKIITVAAAIILNDQHQLLVVRKKNTTCFMQVGGKLESNEPPEQALLREIQEEIGCSAQIQHFVGRFETATANEIDHQLVAYLYLVSITQPIQIAAEIEQMAWIDLDHRDVLPLAPLTTEVVIPWLQNQLMTERITVD
ncbi:MULTISPECIES: NUDIX domain-containing protein [unclassified Acinetobacter]|uniref:NUDIX hydrolase n=1 Tax=unclassified Acinetobacter TaxID=196816 RepID=UPI0029351B11|nr:MULTISPECIES: NUDIX domain-containing protein [unclassified Acinetobacter]WOE31146.1 NUDIX domain-containing protein [Acinetobacter sp. SAAs470]WOE39342.1 NUDIX domain-containing protein [Acinetobacter sp. SAAs474]